MSQTTSFPTQRSAGDNVRRIKVTQYETYYDDRIGLDAVVDNDSPSIWLNLHRDGSVSWAEAPQS